jgi:predicted  nucleic acid-binding Zn-ribbon protein
MDWTTILSIITPVVTGFIGWISGRNKQKNDFLSDLQASIDLLAKKNKELMEEVVKLREENAKLRSEVEELSRKLENVKTITKRV